MNKDFYFKISNTPFFYKSPYGIIILSNKGQIILMNDTAKNIFEKNLINQDFFFNIFENEEEIKKAIKNLKKSKYYTDKSRTKLKYSKSNYTKEFQIEMHYIIDNENNIEYILVFLRSYGEINELIDIFDIHTNYFYSLLNLITDPIFIKDQNKKYIVINKHFENLFGISKEDIINRTDLEIFSSKEAKEYIKSDQYVLTQNLTISEIHWRNFKNPKNNFKDDILCFNTIKSPIFSNSGKPIGIIGISKDITSNQLKILEQKSNLYLSRSIEESMYNLVETISPEKTLKNSLKLICESLGLISIAFYLKDFENKNKIILYSYHSNIKRKKIFKDQIKLRNIPFEVKEKFIKEKYLTINKKNEKISNIFFYDNSVIDSNHEIAVLPVIHNKEIKAFLILINEKEDLFDYFKGEVLDYVKYFGISNSQKQTLSIFSYFLYDLIDKTNEETILKEYSNNLELIQQTIDLAYWTEDLFSQQIKFSKYLKKLIDIPVNKKMTRAIFLSYFDKNSCRKMKRFYLRLKKNNFTKNIILLKNKNGENKVLSFYGKRFENKLIVIVLDITSQKNLENQLLKNIKESEKVKKLATEANEDKSNFLAFLSHELKNMLTATTGISSLLAEKLKNEPLEPIALTLKKNSEQTLDLVNNILDFSRTESNKIELDFKPFSIRNFSDLIEEYYYILAKEKGLNFTSVVDPDVEDIFISDELKIKQITMNLIGNSLKFTQKGFIKLFISKYYSNDKNEEDLVVQVEDSGIGISENDIPNIFKPFKQANKEIYQKFGGTGLGLSIAKNLVELFEGRITVKSNIGVGTNFKFEIPYENKSGSFLSEDKLISQIDSEIFNYLNKFNKLSFLDNKEKINILIYLEDKLLEEKIVSFLNYIKFKYNIFNFDKNRKLKLNLLNYNLPKFIDLINEISFLFIDQNNYKNFNDICESIPHIIFMEEKAIISKNKTTIYKPYTYRKLLQMMIESFLN